MNVYGVTVCVDYADLLARALPRWLGGLDGLLVVTTPKDRATLRMCAARGRRAAGARFGAIDVFTTEAFYADGCVFNKGLAMSEAVAWAGPRLRDWVLTFDADVIPPRRWRADIERAQPRPGTLYGAYREVRTRWLGLPGRRRVVFERDFPGFFQLWHASDPRAQRRPLYDVTWRHAGGYDSEFSSRWPEDRKTKLPLVLRHQGAPKLNWWGRGNVRAMQTMITEREAAGGVAEALERLPGAPKWTGGWRL